MDITKNEIALLLLLLKSPECKYTAGGSAELLDITSMGALKIAKRLENEGVIMTEVVGNAKSLSLALENPYTWQYIKFLLKREAEQAEPYIKRWINEIRKLEKKADAAILFGSVLNKKKDANDIDVMFIIEKAKFSGLSREIDDINAINDKKIHPMYQTRQDFKENIKRGDKPLLSAIKGIIAYGEEIIMGLLK